MGQYFDYNPNLKSNIKEVKYDLLGNKLTFNTNNGVFSKDRVDFGTNVLLNSLPDLSDAKYILDMGCGYGIIGLSLAKGYPNITVDLVDVNLSCIELSGENAKRNHINNVKFYESNIYDYYEKNHLEYRYDVIISNPPIRAGKKVVHDIALEAFDLLSDNGRVFFVIQKKQGAESLFKAMKEKYGNAEIINKQKGYFIITSKKN